MEIKNFIMLLLLFVLSNLTAQNNSNIQSGLDNIVEYHIKDKQLDTLDIVMSVNNGFDWLDRRLGTQRFKNDSIFKIIENPIEIQNFKNQSLNNDFFFKEHEENFPENVCVYDIDFSHYKTYIFPKKYNYQTRKLIKANKETVITEIRKIRKHYLELSIPFFTTNGSIMIVYFEEWHTIGMQVFTKENEKWKFYGYYYYNPIDRY